MAIKVDVTSNADEVIDAMQLAKVRALTIIGLKMEKYAKALCPVGTPESTGKPWYRGGNLRNSITNEVQEDTVVVGTNVEYAPYVELGTGPHFVPPPDWEQFSAPQGSGISHGYVHPRPYLRPAVEDHLSEFKDIMESELKKA